MATDRQKDAISKLVETRGSVSGAMRAAGYADKTAKNPKNLTESKAYKEILGNAISEEELAEKHKELINAEVKIKTFIKGDLVTKIEKIDTFAISKGLDMAYKINGAYAPERSVNLNLDVQMDNEDPKTKALREDVEEKLRQIYEQ